MTRRDLLALLAALEELAAMDPTRGRYEGQCPYCLEDGGHTPDCPWLRAQPALEFLHGGICHERAD